MKELKVISKEILVIDSDTGDQEDMTVEEIKN
jgi:hypothetical protein